MNQKSLYTTVTLHDFNDSEYTTDLIGSGIGMEVSLSTQLSIVPDGDCYNKDLDTLSQEISGFIKCFDEYAVSVRDVRIHQPGGYSLNWSDLSGYNLLKDFFDFCHGLGFVHFVIHAPIGNAETDMAIEMENYRKLLSCLAPDANLEVEEIDLSYRDTNGNGKERYYYGSLFEELMSMQNAGVLLDSYECNGIEGLLRRKRDLTANGFEIKSVHLHRDKHKFIEPKDAEILLTGKDGCIYVNEGFVSNESSFQDFINTGSLDCIMENSKRIELLNQYLIYLNVQNTGDK